MFDIVELFIILNNMYDIFAAVQYIKQQSINQKWKRMIV